VSDLQYIESYVEKKEKTINIATANIVASTTAAVAAAISFAHHAVAS
jgi:hypothetical protein